MEQMFDRRAKGIGDAADVAAQLSGPVGFPLGNGAAAHLAGGRQFVLSEAPGVPEGTYPGADRVFVFHAAV